jgi:peptidoglycan/LPS O-acetylase OafA/YrhL
MLHVPVTTIFISFIFPRVFGRTPYAEGLSLLLSVTIVFIAANLSFRYFEHPLRKLLTRRLPAHRMVDPTGVKI